MQRFKDRKVAKVAGYNTFGYIRETENSVFVTREKGKDTPIAFNKILRGIDAFKTNSSLFQTKPSAFKNFDITYITSPVFALLHLLEEKDNK